MDTKGYLYLACTIGVAVGGMNLARRGIAGPGTLLIFLIPLLGLLLLSAFDLWTFFQDRGSSDRDR